MIHELRSEARRLHETLHHKLSSADRFRKQTLHGAIDLAASRLLREVAGTTWVYGKLTGIGDALGLRTDEGEVFALDATLVRRFAAEDVYRLAKVHAGKAGEPVGPVIELDRPLGTDPARVWEKWKTLLAGGDD